MTVRSFLFVPGDSERKMAKVGGGPADALILDLEDSVAQDRLPVARGMVLEYLKAHPDRSRQQLWVRCNPLETPLALPDLAAVVAGAPDGIVLPKTYSAAEAVRLDHYLSALEAREGLPVGSTRMLVVATETARSLFTLESFVGAKGAATYQVYDSVAISVGDDAELTNEVTARLEREEALRATG